MKTTRKVILSFNTLNKQVSIWSPQTTRIRKLRACKFDCMLPEAANTDWIQGCLPWRCRGCHGTGKSLSEAFILTSTNPQYDKNCSLIYQFNTWKLPPQYMGKTCCAYKLFLFWHSEQFMYKTCSEHVVFMYWTGNQWTIFCHIVG